jgi:hypothetical protein
MPRFIDRHPTNPNPPPELTVLIRQRLSSGGVDEFGERTVNVFLGMKRTYCVSEAPDAEAVRKAHAAQGIALRLEDIEEVQVLP